MKHRKIAAATTAALAGALALAGCGSDNGGGREEGEDVTLSFFTDKAAWEPQFDELNTTSESEGLTLDFTGYSDADQYDAFIKQSFRTNDKPDLFTWHTGDQLRELVESDMVAETSDIWADALEAGYVDEGIMENYTYDGKQYCVPLLAADWVMYYNKDLYEQYDLSVPTTWEELMSNAQTLVDNDVVPFHQMNIIFEFVWFQAILSGMDPDAYAGLSDGSTSYTDPVVVEAMDLWQDMQDKGYFIDPGVTTDPQTLLQSGDVAMAYYGTFFSGQLKSVDMVPDEDYGIFMLPPVDPSSGQQLVVETTPLCVGAGSDDEEAALDYSSWWMGDDAQNAWSQAFGDISFNPNAEVDDPTLSALVEEAASDDVTVQQRWLEATPTPIYSVASEQFGAFVSQTTDAQSVLQTIQDAADSYWADQE